MEAGTLAAAAPTLALALAAGALWGTGLWASSGFRPHVAAGTSFALLLAHRAACCGTT